MSRHGNPSSSAGHRPPTLADRLHGPFARFLRLEAASGVVLLLCTVAALVWANSSYAPSYEALARTRFTIGLEHFQLDKSILLWVNDGLMTIFFFVVGLEIKREVVQGELRDPRKAALPAAAALGGMVVPALLYTAVYGTLGRDGDGWPGWGTPMATDIAFVVGFLALLGKRVPFGLKILLLTLAVVDDLGAVLVIAVFYSHGLALGPLAVAAAGVAVVVGLNWAGVRRLPIFLVVAVVTWVAVLKSGIHPTVTGVVFGLLTPTAAWYGETAALEAVRGLARRLEVAVADPAIHSHDVLAELEQTARDAVSPLERLEHMLQPWVAFVIMPLFALVNAGVPIEIGGLRQPVALAVAVGLALGKPVGIFLFSWVLVRSGLGRLPTGVNWRVMLGGACLAGIGFTMSLFIAGLAFPGHADLLLAAKVGVLAGSLVSALLGCALLLLFLRSASAEESAGGP